MKTIKIKMSLSIGYANANHKDEEEIEVEDDTTDEQIEKEVAQLVEDWSHNYIDLSYSWEAQEGQTNE